MSLKNPILLRKSLYGEKLNLFYYDSTIWNLRKVKNSWINYVDISPKINLTLCMNFGYAIKRSKLNRKINNIHISK